MSPSQALIVVFGICVIADDDAALVWTEEVRPRLSAHQP